MRRSEKGPRRALKYYFFGKISTDLNSQCKNISKKTLGKNFPHYLCPRLVKTSFKQSDQVFSLSPTMRWGGAETGLRRALRYYFFGKISTDLDSQCKNISKDNLGENFPQYLYPHLVKTCFKQSNQVISL